MADIVIYHNPRCTKSRATLERMEARAAAEGHALAVVDYQKTPPDIATLRMLQRRLGLPVREMVRDNEEEYAALGLAGADDEALLAAVAAHPKLLQRPIVVFGERAAIGRPPENVDVLFGG